MGELEQLRMETKRLRRRLREADDCIQAIRHGRVDAFVVGEREQEHVCLLESADGPFRVLVEHMQQGAVTVAPDGRLLYANECMAGLLGRDRQALIGRPFAEFFASEDRALFAALTGGSLERRPAGELRIERPDGTRAAVWLSVESPVPAGGGEICLLVTDLTQQKQHEQLIDAGTLTRLVVEQAPDVVVVCDPDDVVVLASPPAHAICGQNPLWQPFGEMFPLLTDPPALAGLPSPSALEEPVQAREVSLGPSAEAARPMLLSASPVRDAGGARLGSIVTLADIGALKQAECQLKEADRRKDEFLAMLAHELRNPLAPIVSGLEVLKLSGAAREDAGAVFRMVQRQVDQLVRLVDDLLEISRIARGKIELRKAVVDLGEVVNDALETSRPLIRSMQHTLEVDLPREPVSIDCDGVRLSQVIANLLNNAAKYTPRRGHVSLAARVEEGELVIRVSDTGYGIDADSLGSVFEMFTQARLSSPSESGLGVGLALVRTLVEMHGGSVSAASRGRGHGSEFTVRLPVGDTPAGLAREAERPAPASPELERILVVDDNRDSARSLAMLLEILGYEVRLAFDGRAALEELERFHAQAVFLDIDMPGMDGFEVARRIRERGRAVTLIALTGWGQDDDRARSRAAGFDHHLLKPVGLDALRAVLAEADEVPPLPGQGTGTTD